jgi:hypothetical protein
MTYSLNTFYSSERGPNCHIGEGQSLVSLFWATIEQSTASDPLNLISLGWEILGLLRKIPDWESDEDEAPMIIKALQ